MGRLNRLTRVFHALRRSFWVLPMTGCILGVALAFLVRFVDVAGFVSSYDLLMVDADAARDMLGTVAGGTATMMTLTYTLTLLIFTLAAGQLGPRLLDSFYDNRVNQITITVIGTSFVFALVSLWLVREERNAGLATALATFLSIVSVMVLIYFVHDVSQRVLVDNEIARTARRLRVAIEAAFRLPDAEPQREAVLPAPDAGSRQVVHACDTGYLRSIDIEELVGDMVRHDAAVEILVPPGEYVIGRMPVALVRRGGSVTDWEKVVNDRFSLGRSRSSEGDILFSVNLLVEIALRALSPGVNDSYTAVCAVDHLSGAFAELLRRQPSSPLYLDDDGTARVTATVLAVEEIVDTAFHAIRRNAAGNMLVSCAMIDAIRRLIEVSDKAHIPLLRHHADLVGRHALPETATEADRGYLDTRLLTVMGDAA